MLIDCVTSPLGYHRYVTPSGAPLGYGSIFSSVPLQMVVSLRQFWNGLGGVPTLTVNVLGTLMVVETPPVTVDE